MDAEKQMQRMVEAVQPYCDEPISAAMTCSHAGSMDSLLFSKLTGGMSGGLSKTSDLPNPALVAVGADNVYVFDYKPRGFKFKVKKEAARWRRTDLTVGVESTKRMSYFTLTTGSGDAYAMEVATVMGAGEVVDLFLAALTGA